MEVAEVTTTRSKASRQPPTHLGNNKHKGLLRDAMLSLADVQAQVRIFQVKIFCCPSGVRGWWWESILRCVASIE